MDYPIIGFRLSADQADTLRAMADQAGMGLSKYIRSRIFFDDSAFRKWCALNDYMDLLNRLQAESKELFLFHKKQIGQIEKASKIKERYKIMDLEPISARSGS